MVTTTVTSPATGTIAHIELEAGIRVYTDDLVLELSDI